MPNFAAQTDFCVSAVQFGCTVKHNHKQGKSQTNDEKNDESSCSWTGRSGWQSVCCPCAGKPPFRSSSKQKPAYRLQYAAQMAYADILSLCNIVFLRYSYARWHTQCSAWHVVGMLLQERTQHIL